MSVYAISWVLRWSSTRKGDRLVLIALADYARDDGGGAFPSVANIAAKANMSERTVQYALRRLEGQGHIEKTGTTPRGTTVYRILGVQNLHPGVQVATGGGASDDALGVQGLAPNPSIDPSIDPSQQQESDDVLRLFEMWKEATGRNGRHKLTDKRRRHLRARLRDSSVDELEKAIRGIAGSRWHVEKGKTGFHLVFESRDRVEFCIDLLNKPPSERIEPGEKTARPDRSAYAKRVKRNPELEGATP